MLHKFYATGISCIGCVQDIRKILKKKLFVQGIKLENSENLPVVDDFWVNLIDKSVYIESELSEADLLSYLCKELPQYNICAQDKKTEPNHLFYGMLGVFAGATILAITLLYTSLTIYIILAISSLSLTLTVILGSDIYYKAYLDLQQLKFSMDVLFALSTLVTTLVSLVGFVCTGLPMMFDAAPLILGFRHLGISLKNYWIHNLGKQDLFSSLDKKLRDYILSLEKGSVVKVKPGEMFPVNGSLLTESQTSFISKENITGNFGPISATKGMYIQAGTMNCSDIELEIEYDDSSYILDLDKAYAALDQTEQDFSLSKYSEKLLTYFVPSIFVVAIISGIILGCVMSPYAGFCVAISVLVAACPCTLGLVAPLIYHISLGKLLKQGLVFNNVEALDALSEIDCVVFDLNGSLTQGKYCVQNTHLVTDEFALIIASLEVSSKHPIGNAIYQHFAKDGNILLDTEGLKILANGVAGMIAGDNYKIINLDDSDTCTHALYKNDQKIAEFAVRDVLRPYAKELIKFLQERKIKAYICTGDSHANAEYYAKSLGIESANIISSQSSKNKLEFLESLAAKKVAYVGDGPNDILAAGKSLVSFGLHNNAHSSNNSMQTGFLAGVDINLTEDSFAPIVAALKLSQDMRSVFNRSLLMSFIYNVGSVLLVCTSMQFCGTMLFSAGICASLMIVQMLIVFASLYVFKMHDYAEAPQLAEDEGYSLPSMSC
jgi:P-type Cu2+ transporter